MNTFLAAILTFGSLASFALADTQQYQQQSSQKLSSFYAPINPTQAPSSYPSSTYPINIPRQYPPGPIPSPPTFYRQPTNDVDQSITTSTSFGKPTCKGSLVGNEYKYICSGQAPTFQRKYILWLQGGRSVPISIEIPNYRLEDWIEAGFKSGQGQSSAIKILVKKPEAQAQASAELSSDTQPDVDLEYEPVYKKERHFGTDEIKIVPKGTIQEPGVRRAAAPVPDIRQGYYKREVRQFVPLQQTQRYYYNPMNSWNPVMTNYPYARL